MDGVLGEIALGDVDLTAAANASSAAHRIEIDAERARGFEQARAFGELAPLAGGREDDSMGQEISRCNIIQSRIAPISCHARESGHPEKPPVRKHCRDGPGPPFAG